MGLDAVVACNCLGADDRNPQREATCPHIGRCAAREAIDRAGLDAVQGILRQAGGDAHFSTLFAALSSLHGSRAFVAADAVRVLDELAVFRERIVGARGLFLLDVETGVTIYEYVPAYWGEFAWSPQHEVALGSIRRGSLHARAVVLRCFGRNSSNSIHSRPSLAIGRGSGVRRSWT